MAFSSIQYVLFFTLLLTLMKVVKSEETKKWILLGMSYLFYGFWDVRFVLLLAGMSVGNYYFGQRIHLAEDPKQRKRWVMLGVTANLSVLGFFKYFNFFLASLSSLLGGKELGHLHIILPVAISFITFEVISYIVDIYRGTSEPAKDFREVALLVAFFPHLIAGPILRPKQFFPELRHPIVVTGENLLRGGQFFLLGLVKKVLIADRLSMFVDEVYQHPLHYSAATLWLAVIAYGIQIFCDFSGYSDMAIGSAKCLGLEIPPNFTMPYISKNITEFWRRWHISLSSWLRDYLYISLGGNRKGKVRQYINLMLVMLLGGLWHGASWSFMVWGGMHGLGLVVHKLWTEGVGKRVPENALLRGVSWLMTMVFVCITWVFFRITDFSAATQVVRKMFFMGDTTGIGWTYSSLLILLPFVVAAHIVGVKHGSKLRLNLATFGGLFCLFFILLALLLWSPSQPAPFIYFQF